MTGTVRPDRPVADRRPRPHRRGRAPRGLDRPRRPCRSGRRLRRGGPAPGRRRRAAAGRPDLRRQGQHRRGRRAHHGRLPGLRLRSADVTAPAVHGPARRRAPSMSARPTWTSSPPAWSAPAAPTAPCATPSTPSGSPAGRSSGSAVAVALGLVDLALGTDTAGSGRVPAALNGIVGHQAHPRPGVDHRGGAGLRVLRLRERVRPVRSTWPAGPGRAGGGRPLDRATATTGDPAAAARRAARLAGPTRCGLGRLGRPGRPRRGPAPAPTQPPWPAWSAAGCEVVAVDLGPFLRGRAPALRRWFPGRAARRRRGLDRRPPGRRRPGGRPHHRRRRTYRRVAAGRRHRPPRTWLARAAGRAGRVGACSLVLPTVTVPPHHGRGGGRPGGRQRPARSLHHVRQPARPVRGRRAGRSRSDGLPFGVSLIGPAWTDVVQADLAARLRRHPGPAADMPGPAGAARTGSLPLVVAGAHLIGPAPQPPAHRPGRPTGAGPPPPPRPTGSGTGHRPAQARSGPGGRRGRAAPSRWRCGTSRRPGFASLLAAPAPAHGHRAGRPWPTAPW